MHSVGVRELRQNASRYLALVKCGESVQVTERGQPVALLVPVPRSRFEELLATGRIIPPSEPGDIADEEPEDFDVDASAVLAAMREDER